MDKIKECFPYPSARPGQLELIEEGIKALEGGAQNLLIDAPTGTGKTPIAITFARYFSRGYDQNISRVRQKYAEIAGSKRATQDQKRKALAEAQEALSPYQAHMITSMKMLQDQYIDRNTSQLITLMQGKNNYKCRSKKVAPRTSCHDYEIIYGDGRPCQIGDDFSCAYMDAKLAAQFGRLTLHNFDSFISQASLGGSFEPRAVLTIDEAHGAEQKIIDAVSFDISRGEVLDAGGQWMLPDRSSADTVRQWVQMQLSNFEKARKIEQENAEAIKDTSRIMSKADFAKLREIGQRVRTLQETERRLIRYVGTWDKDWICDIATDNETVSFTPVKGSYFAKGALTKFGKKNVFLSATLLDKGWRVMSGLNLKHEETHYIQAPCLFPVHSRRVISTAAVNTGQKEYSKNLEAMCAEIKKLMDRHPGVRGVIHANSYGMAKDIADNIVDRRLIVHNTKNRNDTVKEFIKNSPTDAVLIGVFLKEGYDLKDDICRFQIIPRIPYPYVSKRTQARDEIETGYYNWLTLVDLMQTCGRGNRSAEDECVTYIIDSRLKNFMAKSQHMAPQWFLEAFSVERR